MTDDVYAIYAIRYGRHDRPAHENFLMGDPHDDENMPLDYFVWAVVGQTRTFVLDTGFDPDVARRRGRTVLGSITDKLASVGVDAATTPDVVISHMHYDHAGNLGLFPGARFHLQDAEMAYCTGRCMCHPFIRYPFEASDVAAMVHKVFDGRVQFHDGTSELAPGVTLHRLGGHTKGLQVMRVNTRRGPVVLASDASHLYANLDRDHPFPVVVDVGEYLDSLEALRRLAPSRDHIIPGHDPLVLTRFPPVHASVPDVVRLDADPVG
ncbi:MAG: N-acyl homoserine lactonase family protein [Caulobacteraceae bacterium]